MLGRGMYGGINFTVVRCPVCGETFSKCGLPNHIRRHKTLAEKKSGKGCVNRRSLTWWDGWKEGYKVGVVDGASDEMKRIAKATAPEQSS